MMYDEFKKFCAICRSSFSNCKATYILQKPLYLFSHNQVEELLERISKNAVQGTSILFMYANENAVKYMNEEEIKFCLNELYLIGMLEKYKFIVAEQAVFNQCIRFVNAVYYPF